MEMLNSKWIFEFAFKLELNLNCDRFIFCFFMIIHLVLITLDKIMKLSKYQIKNFKTKKL